MENIIVKENMMFKYNEPSNAFINQYNKTNETFKPVIGTCTDFEKKYYRINDHPDPTTIRPENILKNSMQMLIDKWNNKTLNYDYINEQFKSIRQDLTIQHIQNEFTVEIYETHARIALQSYDLPQFNQCQSVLISLYERRLKGNQIEFFAYRILYTALYEKKEMINIMRLIKEKFNGINKPNEINHAIQVLKALNENNYLLFFKLYKKSPNLGCLLIEPFIPRLRIKALQTIAYGYYTEIEIDFIIKYLCFKSKEECLIFLDDNNIKHGINKKQKEIMYCKLNFSSLNSSNLLYSLIQRKI